MFLGHGSIVRLSTCVHSGLLSVLPRQYLLSSSNLLHHLAQLDHLNVLGTFRPIVHPAHTQVAAVFSVPVQPEIPALKFKLDPPAATARASPPQSSIFRDRRR